VLDPEFERGVRARIRSSSFANWMGFELVGLEPGASELRLMLRPEHLNPGGIAHGGVIASLLDSAIGLALRTQLSAEATHVTVNLSVSYIRPVRAGRLTARGRSVHGGERVGYGEGDLLGEDDRLLARGSATFLVVPMPGG